MIEKWSLKRQTPIHWILQNANRKFKHIENILMLLKNSDIAIQ